MRFSLSVVAIALLSAPGTYFFPWWCIALVSFAVSAILPQQPGKAFLSGFCGIGLLWLIWAYAESAANDHILLGKMAVLFHLPAPWMYIALSVLIGGLTGGLAALSGSLLVAKKKQNRLI